MKRVSSVEEHLTLIPGERDTNDGRRQSAKDRDLQSNHQRRRAILNLAGRASERSWLEGCGQERNKGGLPRLYQKCLDGHATAQPQKEDGRGFQEAGVIESDDPPICRPLDNRT